VQLFVLKMRPDPLGGAYGTPHPSGREKRDVERKVRERRWKALSYVYASLFIVVTVKRWLKSVYYIYVTEVIKKLKLG